MTDSSVEAAWDHLARQMARRRDRRHPRPGTHHGPLGRHLYRLLPLARRRRPARPTAHDGQPHVGRPRVEPDRHGRVRRLLPAGARRAADVRQLRVRRPRAVPLRQGQRPLGRRPGSRRLGSPTATTPTTPSAATTALPSRSRFRYWQLGNETSYDDRRLRSRQRRSTRPSSSPRRCGPSIPSIKIIALGRLRLGGRHARRRRRAPRHAGVPPHVQPRRRPRTRAAKASSIAATPTPRGSG